MSLLAPSVAWAPTGGTPGVTFLLVRTMHDPHYGDHGDHGEPNAR